MAEFDLVGTVRRIRRAADLSQRELASRMGCSRSTVAAVEGGTTGMDARVLARIAEVAGLRLALVDEAGRVVPPMTDAGARDRGYRRLPAHLDTIHSDERRGYWEVRKTRPQPTYTFDRIRADRDDRRRRLGTPPDHHVEQPEDSPTERAAARREGNRRRAAEAHQRWLASGAARLADRSWVCTCPPLCDELDERNGKPVHADGCPCGCDVA